MKRTNLLLTVCASAFLLASCQSEDVVPGVNDTSAMQTRAITGEDYVVENGVLHFTSLDAFFKVTEEIANMPDSLYQIWEKEHNFVSYRTITDRLIGEAEAIEDENEQDAFIAKHANFIKKEDDLILPVMNANLYRSITNSEGVFYINGAKNVVTDSEVIAYNSNNQSINRSSYTITPRATNGIEYEEREYVRSDGARKVISKAKIIIQSGFDGQFSRYAIAVEIFIDGKKKKRGNWKHYSTTYGHDAVRIKLKKTPISVDKNGQITYIDGQEVIKEGASTSNESHNWTVTYAISNPIAKQPQVEHVQYLYYKAYTRGTGTEKLDYKVENGVTLPANKYGD